MRKLACRGLRLAIHIEGGWPPVPDELLIFFTMEQNLDIFRQI